MRMAGDAIIQDSQRANQELMAQQQKIKSVMDRQTARDVAAAQGRIIPFSSADVLRM
jgi:hypothetical protein